MPGYDERVITAAHEAAHSVVALLVGRSVRKVDILRRPSENSLGSTWHFARDGASVEAVLVGLAAGIAGEEYLLGGGVQFGAGGAGDWQMMSRILDVQPGTMRELESLRTRCIQRARQLVWEHWPAIASVANALLERVDLTGEEVETIMVAHGSIPARHQRQEERIPC